MDLGIAGRVALVSGGSRGIGRAIAELLAEEGVRVVIVARSEGPARGFYCNAWDPYHHGQPGDTGYGVRGKPAYQIIRDAFQDIRGRIGATAP